MKPSLLLKIVRIRQKLRFLWYSCLCPKVLVNERVRKALNRELQRHWPDHHLHVHELIHEQWDPDQDTHSNKSDDRFIVFIDHELAVDWITKTNLDTDVAKTVAIAEAVGARRCKHLPREQVLELKRLVGQAIVCAMQGNSPKGKAIAQQASDFLLARTTERSRYWSLLSAHLLVGLTATLLVNSWNKVTEYIFEPNYLALGILGGCLGAYLSLVQRAGKGNWDSAAGIWIHIVEIFTKLFAGAILGGVAIAFGNSVHAPPSLKAITSDAYSVFLIGLSVGLIERLIPRLISQYTIKLTKEKDEQSSDNN